jgi:hypothetical protein
MAWAAGVDQDEMARNLQRSSFGHAVGGADAANHGLVAKGAIWLEPSG